MSKRTDVYVTEAVIGYTSSSTFLNTSSILLTEICDAVSSTAVTVPLIDNVLFQKVFWRTLLALTFQIIPDVGVYVAVVIFR